jgi:hypothetical protein
MILIGYFTLFSAVLVLTLSILALILSDRDGSLTGVIISAIFIAASATGMFWSILTLV